MTSDSPSQRPTSPGPTRLHKTLGVLALTVFLAIVVIDMLPGYTVRPSLAALLVVTYLTLLGFGHIAGRILNLYGTGNKPAKRSNTTTQNDSSEDGDP